MKKISEPFDVIKPRKLSKRKLAEIDRELAEYGFKSLREIAEISELDQTVNEALSIQENFDF